MEKLNEKLEGGVGFVLKLNYDLRIWEWVLEKWMKTEE